MTRREIRGRLAALPVRAGAYAGLCAATVGWASAFLLGKVALAEIDALPAAAWRYGTAAAILLPFALRRREAAGGPVPWRLLAVMVVCGGVLYPWMFLAALQRTSAANTSLLIALNPALTCALAPLVGEPWNRNVGLGIALALVGAALVITHGDLSVLTRLTPTHVGDALAVAAAAVWATFNIAARGVVAHLPHARTNAVVYGLGALALLALAGPQSAWQQVAHASPSALAALGGMVVFSSVIAGQLFLHGVHVLGVSRTVVFIYVVPVLTATAATLFLREPLLPAQVVGGAAVLAGVWVSTRASHPAADAPLDEPAAEVGEPVA